MFKLLIRFDFQLLDLSTVETLKVFFKFTENCKYFNFNISNINLEHIYLLFRILFNVLINPMFINDQ